MNTELPEDPRAVFEAYKAKYPDVTITYEELLDYIASKLDEKLSEQADERDPIEVLEALVKMIADQP